VEQGTTTGMYKHIIHHRWSIIGLEFLEGLEGVHIIIMEYSLQGRLHYINWIYWKSLQFIGLF